MGKLQWLIGGGFSLSWGGMLLREIFSLPGTIGDAQDWWKVLTMSGEGAWLVFIGLMTLASIAVWTHGAWLPRFTGEARFRSILPLIDELLELGKPTPNFLRDAKGEALNRRLDDLKIPHPNLMIRGDAKTVEVSTIWVFFLMALRIHADRGELGDARTLYQRLQQAFKNVSP